MNRCAGRGPAVARCAAASVASILWVGAFAWSLFSVPLAAAQDEVLVVTPRPIGAAQRLVATRGEGDAIPPLAVEGLVPAPSRRVSTRAGDLRASLLSTSKPVLLENPLLRPSPLRTDLVIAVPDPITELPPAPDPRPTRITNFTPGGFGGGGGGGWTNPTVGGKPLDVCAARGVRCGQPAADLYCRAQGYDVASTHSPGRAIPERLPTAHIGTGELCYDEKTCVPFLRINCKKSVRPSTPSTPSQPEEEQRDEVVIVETDPTGPAFPQPDRAAMAQAAVSGLEEVIRLRRERLERLRTEAEAAKLVKGPSALGRINLLEGLHVDPEVGLRQEDVLRIDPQLHRDGNEASGLFYFSPRRFDLGWDPERQYAMTVIYGMAEAEGEEGQVFMGARLHSGVDAGELGVVRELLEAYVRRHAEDGVIRVRALNPLPLAASADVELFGGTGGDFSVPSEDIAVDGPSDALSAIDVSWTIDTRRLLNVETLLRTKADINGHVTFHVASEEDLALDVPIQIGVASPHTFGRIGFDRAAGWHNRTFYPIQLHTLHALILSPESRGYVREWDPIVYSWDLGGATVAPGARVRWDAGAVPAWLDVRALLMWVEYSVVSDCEPCDDRVFSERFIPARPATRQLVFTTGDAFEATGAYRIAVHVRSPFLAPERDRVVQAPAVMLSEDGVEYPVAQLFLSDRELSGAGAREPFYEYSLQVTMRDGRVYASTDWTGSRNLDFLLGSSGIEASLGLLPDADETDRP